MIPCNSNILAAPIYLPLNLKFLYESNIIHSLSFSPHSHHSPPSLPSPHSHHCPPLSHITALPSPHSHHYPIFPHITAVPSITSLSSPPHPHITVLPSLIRISIHEGVYVQIILTAAEETSAMSVFASESHH